MLFFQTTINLILTIFSFLFFFKLESRKSFADENISLEIQFNNNSRWKLLKHLLLKSFFILRENLILFLLATVFIKTSSQLKKLGKKQYGILEKFVTLFISIMFELYQYYRMIVDRRGRR